MAVMEVRNNNNTGWLIMWLEPLGEDRWLAPGEVFQVRSDYTGNDQAFSITCWVNDEDTGQRESRTSLSGSRPATATRR